MFKKIAVAALVLSLMGITTFSGQPEASEAKADDTSEEEGFEPIVVLELFTSQGCSSCPSADALLARVKKNSGNQIFTLSYHVDYWNYIGWEDPFSASSYARKQQLYNRKFQNRGNYTPQMVVNGKEHFVGSNAAQLHGKIATYKKIPAANKIVLSDIVQNKDEVAFNFEIEGDIKNKDLRTLLVLDERITEVSRGENKNRTLLNSNIVVSEKIKSLQEEKGTTTVTLPNTVLPGEAIQLVVLLEDGDYEISGAVKNDLVRK